MHKVPIVKPKKILIFYINVKQKGAHYTSMGWNNFNKVSTKLGAYLFGDCAVENCHCVQIGSHGSDGHTIINYVSSSLFNLHICLDQNLK